MDRTQAINRRGRVRSPLAIHICMLDLVRRSAVWFFSSPYAVSIISDSFRSSVMELGPPIGVVPGAEYLLIFLRLIIRCCAIRPLLGSPATVPSHNHVSKILPLVVLMLYLHCAIHTKPSGLNTKPHPCLVRFCVAWLPWTVLSRRVGIEGGSKRSRG